MELVCLDRDHPGFRDRAYRARRDAIAKLAFEHRDGDPVPEVVYTDDEHAVWREVRARLVPLHARRACREVLEAQARLPLDHDRIPQLEAVNRALARLTGMRLLPVAGLASAREFMMRLADDVFLATQYIRHHSRPLYTPEPDVVHELVGHAATLSHPRFVALNRQFGVASGRAEAREVERLIRVYWYTLEFGLVREAGELKAVGAGLLSSFGELAEFETCAEIRSFDLERIAETPFDPTSYQRQLFAAESFEVFEAALVDWLAFAGR